MSQPLVSILIPAFNAERWIGETLESALAQTWPRKEILVVDDGSTDGTVEVVGRFERRGVRLVCQGRRGPSAAQNEAYRQAQGDFLQRLDADDLLSPDKIERQLERIAADPASVACGAWARFHAHPDEAAFEVLGHAGDLDPVEWLVRECRGGLPMLQPGRWLVPRAVAEAAGPWDERLTLNNDFEYFVRVALASDRIRFTPGARLYYRSGHAHSLASVRSPAAWQSALLSLELGTGAWLARDGAAAARQASADLFQRLAFDAYLDAPAIARAAERRAAGLGGSIVRMDGGALFAALRRTLGWKRAKRVKRFAYAMGYSRLARLKESALGRGRWRTA